MKLSELKKEKKTDHSCIDCDARSESVFCSLKEEALHLLDKEKNHNSFKRGQNLFVEGNPPFGLYCVSSGKVKLTKTTSEGKEVIIRIAGPGEVLGHRSLFSENPYNATATALSETQVCFISKGTIENLIDQNPKLTMSLLGRLSEQMGIAETRLVGMAHKNLRERLAATLLSLAETYGQESSRGIRLDIKLTREELASLIGAATENLIRLMTEFKKDGLILEEAKEIYLLDIESLSNLAAV